jgi:superfamily II DNA/RNA helicase
VATPGRLSYMIEENPFHFRFLDSLKFLVLDEFDQLLNETILPEVNKIIEKIPEDRQTLFFSATINYQSHNDEFFKHFYTKEKPKIYDLTIKSENESRKRTIDIKAINDGIKINEDKTSEDKENSDSIDEDIEDVENLDSENNKIDLIESKKIVKNLIQNYILVPNNTKEHYLIHLLLNEYKKKYIIIFISSCKRCHFLSLFLQLFNLRVSTIHSKMPQRKRFENLENFKNKKNNILVSTDISSRGLDIQNVELVINYDIPRAPQDYIHRVGRTARAGNKGLAVSFVTQYDIDLITAIEDEIQIKMTEKAVEESAILEDISLVSKAIRVVQMKIYESGFMEKLDDRKERDGKNRKKKL